MHFDAFCCGNHNMQRFYKGICKRIIFVSQEQYGIVK